MTSTPERVPALRKPSTFSEHVARFIHNRFQQYLFLVGSETMPTYFRWIHAFMILFLLLSFFKFALISASFVANHVGSYASSLLFTQNR